MKNLFILIYFLFNLLQYGSAQGPFIKNFTTQDGLPSNTVYQIYQDSKKFLWFTTDAGVVKYDGTNFITYRKKDGLSSNDVVRIKEDACGRIWLFNYNSSVNYIFNNVVYNKENSPHLNSLRGKGFLLDFYIHHGVINFYNLQCEVFSLDSNNIILRNRFLRKEVSLPLKWNQRESVRLSYVDIFNNGMRLWTVYGIYFQPDLNSKTKSIDSTLQIINVFPISNNEYIINTLNKGLIKVFLDKFMYKKFNIPFNSLKVKTLIKDSSGFIWISAYDEGVFCFKDDKIIEHINIREALGILEDHEGNIWVSTQNNGIYLIKRDVLTQKHYSVSFFNNLGIKEICLADDAGIWCTNGYTLFKMNKGEIFYSALPWTDRNVDIILPINGNTLILGKRNSHFYVISGIYLDRMDRMIKYKKIEEFIIPFKGIIFDRNSQNVYLYDQNRLLVTNTRYLFRKIDEIYFSERINNAFIDYSGKLVVNGKKSYFLRDNRFYIAEGLSKYNTSLFKDHSIIDSCELFILDGDQIEVYNENGLRFSLTKSMNSTIDYQISKITNDGNSIFFSTISMIFRIGRYMNMCFGKEADVQPLDYFFRSINDLQIYNDSLFIASEEGLTIISLKRIHEKERVIPIPYISDVLINDKKLNVFNSLIKVVGNNTIQLISKTLDFSNSPMYFSYKLEGFSEAWSTTLNNDLNVIFQNLPKGEYIFKLRVRKSNSDWSKPIQLKIIIKPTFYEYPIFWVGVVIVLAFIAFLIALRIKTVRANKAEMNHKLIQNEQRALLSMMNPHFIFNSLGSIQNYMLKNKVGEAIIFLTQFGRLIRQNVRAVNVNIIEMDDEVERIKNYLELEQIRLENNFDYFIEMEESFMEDVFYVPSMIIQPFVENSIWHGIANIDFRGIIRVKFVVESDKLIKVIVEDNGIGMKRAHAIPSDTRFHLRMSMEITQRRLKLLREKYEANSHIEHSELYPGNVCPGTRTTIYLPYSCKKPEIEYTIQGVE